MKKTVTFTLREKGTDGAIQTEEREVSGKDHADIEQKARGIATRQHGKYAGVAVPLTKEEVDAGQ
jgi:hypothetical protein